MDEKDRPGPPENRCGFTFPDDLADTEREMADAIPPYSCYRLTEPEEKHCFWHSEKAKELLALLKESKQNYKTDKKPQTARTLPVPDLPGFELVYFPEPKTKILKTTTKTETVKSEPKSSPAGQDFSDQDLENRDFTGKNLTGANFKNAILVGTNFSEANLEGADFTNAELEDAVLAGANLKNANLTDTYFMRADLKKVNLENAKLNKAFLMEANLTGANLENATITGANFLGAKLKEVIFRGADLSGADLSGTKINQAFMMNTKLVKTNFYGAELQDTDLRESNLSKANLSNTDLSETVLRDAQITDAKIERANLTNANLVGADLSGSTLASSCLKGVNLEHGILSRNNLFDADLTDCRLYGTIISNVQINEGTVFRSTENPNRDVPWWKINLSKEPPRCIYDPDVLDGLNQLGKAVDIYRVYEKLARDNSLSDLESEMFILRKDMQRKLFWKNRKLFAYLFSLLSRIIFKYGESITRLLFWGATIILTSTIVVANFEILVRGGEYVCHQPLFQRWFNSLFFSTIIFATLGEIGFDPVTNVGKLLIMNVAIMGSIWLALLIFVLGRWATK